MDRLYNAIILILLSLTISAQNDLDKSRQFDFWIGQWDVNLRMIQADNTWENKVQSKAHIYSILGGKATLELWNESEVGIIGHSLRYYNPVKDKWDLFLNWPGKNTSGTGYKEGFFRHGRGEFYNTSNLQDTSLTIERYTFTDVTPQSLRWDDGYSTDGGRTWKSNWIMEFSRTAGKAPTMFLDVPLNTYYSGGRCDADEFQVIKSFIGDYEGGLKVYPILDGCSVMGLSDDLYFKFTYNTYASLYELTVLDANQDHALWIYYGNRDGDQIALKSSKDEKVYESKIDLNNIGLSIDYYQENIQVKKMK